MPNPPLLLPAGARPARAPARPRSQPHAAAQGSARPAAPQAAAEGGRACHPLRWRLAPALGMLWLAAAQAPDSSRPLLLLLLLAAAGRRPRVVPLALRLAGGATVSAPQCPHAGRRCCRCRAAMGGTGSPSRPWRAGQGAPRGQGVRGVTGHLAECGGGGCSRLLEPVPALARTNRPRDRHARRMASGSATVSAGGAAVSGGGAARRAHPGRRSSGRLGQSVTERVSRASAKKTH